VPTISDAGAVQSIIARRSSLSFEVFAES
jgi:hypothetical protein